MCASAHIKGRRIMPKQRVKIDGKNASATKAAKVKAALKKTLKDQLKTGANLKAIDFHTHGKI
jgi:hypothetical protein